MSRYVSREAEDAERVIRDVQARVEGNNYCADCGHPRPEYINLTIGTFICELCTELHRSMSNRRIKDIYNGDLTYEDVRRMENVGNDVANRKFLATWNPRDVPEPDRRDKEALREFLWLKYDGSFKRQKPGPAPPVQSQNPPPAYRPDDRYYDDRVQYDRGRGDPRREHDLFRNGPQQNPERGRGYWASKYDNSNSRMPPPQQLRQRDDYYGRAPAPPPPYPDRYRAPAGLDRFQPPQPSQPAPYGRPMRNPRMRYQDQGAPYEDYASFNSDERDMGLRRGSSQRSRRSEASQDGFGYSDGDVETDRAQRKGKQSSKSKNKPRRKKSSLDGPEANYYSDEEEANEEVATSKKSKRKDTKKSRKSKSKKKEIEEEDEEYETEEEDSEDDDVYEDDRATISKKSKRKNNRSEKRSERDRDSVVTVDVEDADISGSAAAHPAKAEFDLMSEWMGESKDTAASHTTPTGQGNNMPSGGPIPPAMQQAYATQVPMMPPPMSVYGGMMPMAGGGFMPMMPGFVPGMGMPGMPPPPVPQGMPGGVAPPIPPSMLGMPGAQGAPGQPHMTGQMHNMMNGMQGLNLNQPSPPSASSANPPPPPPPVGMPAGPAPGPPPGPPES